MLLPIVMDRVSGVFNLQTKPIPRVCAISAAFPPDSHYYSGVIIVGSIYVKKKNGPRSGYDSMFELELPCDDAKIRHPSKHKRKEQEEERHLCVYLAVSHYATRPR